MRLFLALFTLVAISIAHAQVPAPAPADPRVFGLWLQENPTIITPGFIVNGQLELTAAHAVYTSICTLRNGFSFQAQVDSLAQYSASTLSLLESKYSETQQYGYTCYARIAAGVLYYKFINDHRLMLSIPGSRQVLTFKRYVPPVP